MNTMQYRFSILCQRSLRRSFSFAPISPKNLADIANMDRLAMVVLKFNDRVENCGSNKRISGICRSCVCDIDRKSVV